MDPVTCQVTEDSLRQTLRAKDVGVHRRRPLRLRHGLLGKLLAVTVAPATFHRNVVQPTNGPPSNYHALQPRLNFVPSPLKGQLLFTRGPVATSMVRQLSDEPEPLKRWKSGANDVRGGSEPDRNVLAFAGNRSRGILDKMWSIAERYNIVVTSVVGANFVLRNYASAGLFSGAASLAQLPTACLAAASAALTTFGGGTQSQLLHWAATFAAGERPLEPLRFGWQRFDPHVGAFMGWSIALVLHCTGRSGFLDGAIWKLALAINWGITVGFGVVDSGWFSKDGSSCRVLSWLGVFLFCVGGGLARDLISKRMPSVLTMKTLVPLVIGLLYCGSLYHLSDGAEHTKQLVFATGLPTTAFLFATCA